MERLSFFTMSVCVALHWALRSSAFIFLITLWHAFIRSMCDHHLPRSYNLLKCYIIIMFKAIRKIIIKIVFYIIN